VHAEIIGGHYDHVSAATTDFIASIAVVVYVIGTDLDRFRVDRRITIVTVHWATAITLGGVIISIIVCASMEADAISWFRRTLTAGV
jgi:hypothetical protein